MVLPLNWRSDRRGMAARGWSPGLTAASCHSWAVPAPAKLLRLIVIVVVADGLLGSYRFLLTTMTVRAPSDARTDAKASTWSGLATEALTLVSPKPEPLPS